MAEWLRQNFLRVGVIAIVMDVISRFYIQIGLSWISQVSSTQEWSFARTLLLGYFGTALDMLSSLLWGLFSLGFAMRVIAELSARSGGTPQ